MSKPELRQYQKDAIEQIEGAMVFGSTEISLNGPTSFGKTITMAQFIKDQVDLGRSVVFMMNLTALVEQTMDTLKSLHVPYKVVAAEFDGLEFDHQAKVTIAMQQTLYARLHPAEKKDGKRNKPIEPPKCDVLVVDEFHRSFRTDTMEAVKHKLKPEVIVGVSATNYDEKGYALQGVDIIETKTVRQLTDDGFLTPLRVYSVEFAEQMDYTEAGSGEYSEQFLNGKINNDEFNEHIVNAWHKIAKGKKTIAFCTGIEHSEALAENFRASGEEAYAYHSKMTKKHSRAIMDKFKKDGGILCSVGKVLVGFDDPSIECGIAARPTRTRRVWQQACGRMIRLFEGKKEAILLDCAQWTSEHGFYDDDYHAPDYGDKEGLKKEKEKAAIQVMPTIVAEEPTLVDRNIVLKKVEELDAKRKQIPELQVKDLIAIYETSQEPLEILRVAFEMNRRKTGTTYTRANVEWISEEWDTMIKRFPQYHTRLLKTLRTMAKNKVSGGKKLAALHYSPEWLMEQSPYRDYTEPDSVDVSDEVAGQYEQYDDLEVPF